MTTHTLNLSLDAISPETANPIVGSVDGDTIELHVLEEPEVGETLQNLYAYLPAGTVVGETRIVRLLTFPRTDYNYGVRLVSDCYFDVWPAYAGSRLVFNLEGATAFLKWSGMTWLCQVTAINADGTQAMLVDTIEWNRQA